MLKENLWLKFDIVSIYKPYVVAKFVDDLQKLGKELSKQDLIVVRGPGNSLDIVVKWLTLLH